jgi:acetyl-CoA acetyltransferase
VSADRPEDRVVLSGVGVSDVGRRTGRSDLALTMQSIDRAVTDAGLTLRDIDGLATFPGAVTELAPGFAGPHHWEVADALRLEVGWQLQGFLGASQIGILIEAILAVSAGLCRHAVVYRTVTESSGQHGGPRRGLGAGLAHAPTQYSWLFPIGAVSAANHFAMYAQAYMSRYGMTREQLGGVALAHRRHAARNPWAVLRSELTLPDYLSARMISDPLCLFDCDLPVDASTAIVVSSIDTVADLRAPVGISAIGTASRGRLLWEQWNDLTTMAAFDAAEQMWTRTDLGPNDVDVAQLYDGFSIATVLWLEALGFCGRGEAGAFLDGGRTTGPGGSLPVNTWGGQLSAGRLHGYGYPWEAVLQLRGEADARQVIGAEVAAVGVGAGHVAGAMLLHRLR